METAKLLSQKNLNAIKDFIQVELLKRGITAPIISIEEKKGRGNYNYIEFYTELFQTMPVIFKELRVGNFSTSVDKKPKSELRQDLEGEYTAVWISVYFTYKHFGNGGNGHEIFNIWFNVFGENYDDVKMSAIR